MNRNALSLTVFSIFTMLIASVSTGRAATVNVQPGANLASIIGGAHYGDVIQLGSGTFNLSAPITVPSGVTVAGTSVSATHVVFNLAGGNTTSYGFVIAGNATNTTLTQMDMYSNHGLINMGSGSKYTNITISRNNLEFGGGQFADGTLVFGISGTIPNNGLQITHNYLHDSPNSVRNWCIWYLYNASIDHNFFYNIADGGQICTPGPNVSFSYNYGVMMHRMGQEVSLQDNSNFLCNGNVFYGYVTPYYDTEGVSIVGGTGEVDITNNYFCASGAPGTSWGPPDSGGMHRFGYAIECTGRPGNVTGNTLVGVWAALAAADMTGVNCSNNTVVGTGIWWDFGGEPGPFGMGSTVGSGNKFDSNLADAPRPPSNTFAGPQAP